MRNLITDVAGVLVGNAQDMRAATGATVAIFEEGAIASISTLGGAPGDRMATSLEPEAVGQAIDAVVLSGGSVYGLDAAGGASAVLCQRGQGRTFGGLAIPVAVQAILFDLINGGEKDWMREPVKHKPPYWDLGRDAALVASLEFALGTAGAGVGATTAGLKGGLGSTSAKTSQGFTVGALVAVNAVGAATIGSGPHFWAGAYEQGNEFGGLGWPAQLPDDALRMRFKGQPLPVTATPPSPWSPPTRRSPRRSASVSPSWPMTGSRSRCGRCMRPTTATRCSRRRPAVRARGAIRRS